MKIKTKSAQETQKLAENLSQKFKNKGGILALIGDLGAGKTTFTQGFAQGLGIKDKIISPTFVLVRQHPIMNTKNVLYHLDLYRLDSNQEISELGINELINNNHNIVLIEWAEKINDQLPESAVKISFKRLSENEREIEVINAPS